MKLNNTLKINPLFVGMQAQIENNKINTPNSNR